MASISAADFLFPALKDAIANIQPKSATPIARILQKGKQIEGRDCLDFLSSCPSQHNHNPSGDRAVAAAQSQQHDELVVAVERARKEHAERLRDENLRDVNVWYYYNPKHPVLKKHPKIMMLKEDMKPIKQHNGECYHLWPLQNRECGLWTIGISVIISTQALNNIYPMTRLRQGGIGIFPNTVPALPAPTNVSTRPVHTGSIFPNWKSELSKEAIPDPATRKQRIDDEIEKIVKKRPRSKSIEKIKTAPKGPWHVYSSFRRSRRRQPAWSASDAPFSKHNVGEAGHWIKNDFRIRKYMLEEFLHKLSKQAESDEEQYDEVQDAEDDWEDVTSESDFEEITGDDDVAPPMSVARFKRLNRRIAKENLRMATRQIPAHEMQVAFPILPGLSHTYVLDLDATAMEKAVTRTWFEGVYHRRRMAENEYQKQLARVDQAERILRQAVINARLPQNRYSRGNLMMVMNLFRYAFDQDGQLRGYEQRLVEKRVECVWGLLNRRALRAGLERMPDLSQLSIEEAEGDVARAA